MDDAETLSGFGASRSELLEAAEKLRIKKSAPESRRICVCGHAVSKHSAGAGRVSCSPTRMTCPCRAVVPVIVVSDTRPFLRKTKGPGVEHALMQGLQGLIEKGRTWEWVEGFPVCGLCEKREVDVLPYAIDAKDRVSWEPEGNNVLLCLDCASTVLQRTMGVTEIRAVE